MADSGDFKRTNRWTQEEFACLEELIESYPPALAIRTFSRLSVKQFGHYRSSNAINKILVQRNFDFKHGERCDYIDRKSLAYGLGIACHTIKDHWEKLGLKPDKAASSPHHAYYKKETVRKFFMDNPKKLSKCQVQVGFAATFVGILTGEW